MANKIQRICCVCRVLQPTADMIRVVRVGTEFLVQTDKRLNGRGCHVCRNCLAKAIEKKAFNRSFKCPLPQEIYNQLATMAQNDKLK